LTIIGKNPSKYGFSVVSAPSVETDRVTVDKATDLRVIAEAIDVPVEELRALNTHLLRWTTPPDDPDFQLILPKGYADKFKDQISSLPEAKRIIIREHVVHKGETLGGIAKKYGVTTAQIIQANNFGKTPVLRVGQTLAIPISGVTPPVLASSPSSSDRPARTQTTATAAKSAVATTARYYTVRSGDTLAKIAARFNTTVEKLKAWNHLTSTKLTAGKRLMVSPATTSGGATRTAKVVP
jgi:membrane-bound lytic murein transglycosylase D